MTRNVLIIFGLCFGLFLLMWPNQAPAATESANIFAKAGKAAKEGQIDFAFMHYRSLLVKNPNSKYKNQAIFASGEYHFLNFNYDEAISFFNRYCHMAKDSDGKLFALAYLLKLAEREENHLTVEDLTKEILSYRRQSFVFKKSKEYNYRSPLYREHRVVYNIDKIEFFIEGELFAKVSY